ncbi:asparaginase [Methylococcaceae bacterium HT4]|nr:asparaginase [Methylococcaceae bacterium CS5]TXK95815.1 asparaginase [Methylococcaceae bacterium CS4]TXL02479.1 asparaginase [Methylococcaceae bacterium CS1]TXL04772.1 asparaginase [Methylococcaceae bacterium CS3]TXL09809.1 asparaginase [Methylococcaceae bacterium CS2]TXL13912.1 asparaginase [Methylococcaceae bacterium HT4]TXL19618.1 asparaginase [Methylococcaceae bacterium HT5]TXL21673.1 asparaginase [Methylococcaceae bacterium HT2]
MIQIIITGGTLDKHYNELNGELDFPETHIPEMLKQARCSVDIEMQLLMLKDSLEMTEADRDKIKQSCIATDAQQILITHGTDTMVETARCLAAMPNDKTIVLIGAMIPYAIKQSDALFNLGSAITAVQLLPAGIYITMNGQVFDWDKVRKDRKAGEFQSLGGSCSGAKN